MKVPLSPQSRTRRPKTATPPPPSLRGAHVCFSPKDSIREIPSLDSFTSEEITSTWYQESEYERIYETVDDVIDMLVWENNRDICSSYDRKRRRRKRRTQSARGLERFMPDRVRSREKQIQEAWDVVIDTQLEQWKVGFSDPYEIAEVYGEVTSYYHHVRIAHLRGLVDERKANKIHAKSNNVGHHHSKSRLLRRRRGHSRDGQRSTGGATRTRSLTPSPPPPPRLTRRDRKRHKSGGHDYLDESPRSTRSSSKATHSSSFRRCYSPTRAKPSVRRVRGSHDKMERFGSLSSSHHKDDVTFRNSSFRRDYSPTRLQRRSEKKLQISQRMNQSDVEGYDEANYCVGEVPFGTSHSTYATIEQRPIVIWE